MACANPTSQTINDTAVNLTYDIELFDPVIVFSLKGRITAEEDFQELQQEVFDHLNQNYYRVVFDLSELTHTNSVGIGFFMRTLTKTRIMNGDLVLVNIHGNVQKIFEIAKLNEVYTLRDSVQEGIAFFSQT